MNGVQDQAITHQALVHEDVDAVAVGALRFGPRHEPAHAQVCPALLGLELWLCDRRAHRRRYRRNLQQLLKRLPAKKLIDALGGGLDRRHVEYFLGGRLQNEMLVGMRQRVMGHQRRDVTQFGGV